MSYIPVRKAESLKSRTRSGFLGLDRRESAGEGEFIHMKNLSCRTYPYITQRLPRSLHDKYNYIKTLNGDREEMVKISNVRACIAAKEGLEIQGFTGVIGEKFYYNGEEKKMCQDAVYDDDGAYRFGMAIAPDGVIQLLWANNTIIIHGYNCSERMPYIYYYDTADYGKDEDYVKSYEYTSVGGCAPQSLTVGSDATGTMSFNYVTASKNFDGDYYDFKVGDSVFIDELMVYSDSRWEKVKANKITSAVVTSYTKEMTGRVDGNYKWKISIGFSLTNYKGKTSTNSEYITQVEHIYKKIPYMTHLAMHKGRLWGANPNGEYIYASALGDLFNFNAFEGLSGDSLYLESASQGGYLGVISCGDALVSLKTDETEVIYGELPEEFAVGKSYPEIGCIDINSCAVIDSSLYFLARKGFYCWDGSRPKLISEDVNTKYLSAFSYSDGINYYASAITPDNICENLVFDTKYGLWHIEDDVPVRGFFKGDSKFCILSENSIYSLNSGDEEIKWSAESAKYFFDDYELNRVNEIILRVKTEPFSKIRFYTRVDGEEWRLCHEYFSNDRAEYRKYVIPIRLEEGIFWQYRIEGEGGSVIYGMKLCYDDGGRVRF